MLYLGVDPGLSGALAGLNDHGDPQFIINRPSSDLEMVTLIREVTEDETVRVLIERIDTGYAGSSKSSVAKLYGDYRAWVVAFTALAGVPDVVTADKWQGYYNLSSVGRGKKNYQQHKRNLRDLAKSLYPSWSRRITLDTCDALLIAGVCREMNR